MRLLLVEDDPDIRSTLKAALESECFAVDVAEDGERGSYLARTNGYDAVILDFVLPRKNGLEVCQEIRKSGKTTPIIMLTVNTEVDSKVQVLNSGADDYLTKPFSFEELLARLRSLMRRPHQIQDEVYKVDDLSLDVRSHRATRGKSPLQLTRKEFMLLEYLMRHRGAVVSRAILIEHVWDMDLDPLSNSVDTHILRLRKKLNVGTRRKLIHTVSGLGYKLDAVS